MPLTPLPSLPDFISYTNQGFLLRDGTSYSGLTPSLSRKFPIDMPTVQFNGGRFSVDSLFSVCLGLCQTDKNLTRMISWGT